MTGDQVALAITLAQLSGVKLQGPLLPKAGHKAAAGPWTLAPLAGANGTVRAEIVDAHLGFDADVTVQIRQGGIDFDDATVEHVGPDSRMGVSKLGLYVDAPNGRSYIYQFPSTPVAGVEFERRGPLLGAVVLDRGKLRLQEFGEARMAQGPASPGAGFTAQARPLFDRTALSGELRLGDGKFAAPGVQAELVGRGQGRNIVSVQSPAVGRGLTATIASLSVRNVALDTAGMQVRCDEVTGALTLRLFAEGGDLRFELSLESLKVSGLRVEPAAAAAPA